MGFERGGFIAQSMFWVTFSRRWKSQKWTIHLDPFSIGPEGYFCMQLTLYSSNKVNITTTTKHQAPPAGQGTWYWF